MNYGTIRISTNPTGATVYVNSQNKGITPIDIVNAMPGIYNITLSYPDVNSYNFDTVVIDGKMTIVRFDFTVQEVTEEHISLTGTDLVPMPVPPGLPEEQPPSIPPNVPIEQPPGMSLQKVESLLDKNNELLTTLLQHTAKTSGFDTSERYFNQNLTAITVATPNQPSDPDSTATDCQGNLIPGVTSGYDRVCIHNSILRNSRTVSVFNLGSSDLFVITSSDGEKFSAAEIPVLKGEYKRFFNVYELRIRSPVVGNLNPSVGAVPGGIYTVTEYETETTYSNVNKPDFFILAVPNLNTGAGWNSITIIGDIINLPIVLRATATNTATIYMAHSTANLGVTTARIILNPGDVVRINNTRGARYFFRGAAIGQGVEFLSETD